ncbi:YcdB/YcdC domain-containing protein [Paenibacillus lemnae]|uniref:S-layer protein n=1 Tax=Paenibacillus lemnae TaxID=1330551 RepID=A0A848MAS2_PAELE|nr:YcdB/YcdC domain-containing protein [Paenibacillus lemnae]NMO97260.1 S-layer protein [Paenibacillus lemnae]
MSNTRNRKNALRLKSTVCAVTAMLCLVQPAWGAGLGDDVKSKLAEAAGEPQAVVDKGEQAAPEGAKVSAKQAEQNVRKLFPVLDQAKMNRAEYRESNQGSNRSVWDLQWSYQRGNSGTGFNATVDAVTGDLLSIHLPRILFGEQNSGDAELTKEQAEKLSLEWITKNVRGIDIKEWTNSQPNIENYQSLFSPVTYHFYFQGTYDGIPSDGDTIRIAMDQHGNVTMLDRMQSTVKPDTTKPGISAELIRKQYETQFTPELVYMPVSYSGRQTGPYFLAWVPDERSQAALDAATGKPFDAAGVSSGRVIIDPVDILSQAKPFQPAAKPLTSGKEAAGLVEAHFAIPKNYKLESSTLGNRWNSETEVWSLYWASSDQRRGLGSQISAEVNAATGQIYNVHQYTYLDVQSSDQASQPAPVKISSEQAKKTAIDLVKKLVPDAARDYKLTNINEPIQEAQEKRFHFSFNRYAGGHKIWGESVNVSIDGEGKIIDFYNSSNLDPKDLPKDSKTTITAEQAKKAYLDEIELKLKFAQYGGYFSGNANEPLGLKLVYVPVNHNNQEYFSQITPLDAVSGKWREIVSYGAGSAAAAVDIQGHTSYKALDKLLKFRVIQPDQDGKVYPDAELSTGDWFTMAARSVYPDLEPGGSSSEPYGNLQPDSPYYPAVQMLVSRNWLPYTAEPSFSTERKLTRDELALRLMQMLKYDKLSLSFNSNDSIPGASDGDAVKNRGAVIIAVKLGLLPLEGGKFMPERIVTKAEAAEVLVRLAAMAGKSDNFLNENYYW